MRAKAAPAQVEFLQVLLDRQVVAKSDNRFIRAQIIVRQCQLHQVGRRAEVAESIEQLRNDSVAVTNFHVVEPQL